MVFQTRSQINTYTEGDRSMEEISIQLIDQLLTELMTGEGNNALDVPMLDTVRMQHIWCV